MPFRASAPGAGTGSVPGHSSNPTPGRVPMSAIIADDEPLAREELRFLLNEIGDVEVVGAASNGIEALDLIEKLDPALAFLDIQMPGLDGLGVVRRLRENQIEPPHIIFSTAFEQFAVEAFKLEAMDYLLKPVDRDRLAATLARARRAVADRITESVSTPSVKPAFTRLLVRSGSRNLVISPEELVYATIANGVITLTAANAEGQSNFRTLEELQAALDPDMFWRAHRSYLVNVNRIREVVPWFKSTYQLRMDDKKASEIPVSRLQSRRLREMLNL
jgi:two-component system response regulator LytT